MARAISVGLPVWPENVVPFVFGKSRRSLAGHSDILERTPGHRLLHHVREKTKKSQIRALDWLKTEKYKNNTGTHFPEGGGLVGARFSHPDRPYHGFVLFYIDGLVTASFITVFLYAAWISRHFTENKFIHKCTDNLKRDWTLSSTAIPLSFGHCNTSLFINGSEFDFLQNYLPTASQTKTVISDTWFVAFSKTVITFIEQPRR